MSAARSLPDRLGALGFVAFAAVLLVAAGQPLITDDAWLHLALGRAYASVGPWLEADPLLANALGPPTPAAWLFDVTLYGVERTTGFTGLRIAHVVLVAAILGVAWGWLRRASNSVVAASLAGSLFAVLAAYRLIQLRPHLLSILAALAVYRLVIDRDARPSPTRVAAVVILLGVWANVHAAFLLGPMLLGTAFASVLVTLPLRPAGTYARERGRLLALGAAGGLGSLATFANPSGAAPHLAWFVAGDETPSLGRVADEWLAFDPFALPLAGLPPSPLTWAVQWGLLLATLAAVAYAIASWRREHPTDDDAIDPALVGLALVGLALPFVAVRFLWLGFFPLLLVVQAAAHAATRRPRLARPGAWATAGATALVLVGFFQTGPWRSVSGMMPRSLAGYRQPYPPGKYHAHLIFVLQDAGLVGTAFADYHVAGFAGAYLAPDVRTLVNGTLNVSPDVIAANLPLRQRRGERDGERFVELLDRHGIDLYLGTRLPQMYDGIRPMFHTTAHLERTPGWIPVFRNVAGAVYLRADERNRDNLDRVASWYAEQDVPFDPRIGFDVEEVVRRNRGWAIQHGIVPMHFDRITRAAYGSDPESRVGARAMLASLYAALGLYERAVELDRSRVIDEPEAMRARRRLVWSLLRLGRYEEAVEHAGELAEQPESDRLSHRIATAARTALATDDDEARRAIAAQLPVFDAVDVAMLTGQIVVPAPRRPPG